MKLTDQEQVILKAIGYGVAEVSRVIKAVGYPKATVKKVLVRLSEKGAIALHRHDWPKSLKPEQRKLMVRIGSNYYSAVSVMKRNPKQSKGKTALKKTGRALKGFARGALGAGAQILGAGAEALNPVRRKVRNKYIDLVIKGQAKKTPQGWQVGKKTFAQGRGTVSVSSGYYLDKHTGMVYAKRERNKSRRKNVEQGFYDASGFHPIRASSDYSEGQRPSRSKRAKATKRKAGTTASHKRKVSSRKATTKRLASRSIKKTVKSRRRRNVAQGFYDSSGFHPIRASADYDPGIAGETGRKAKTTRSRKKLASKRKASQTARRKRMVTSRKRTTSRLAGRAIKKSSGLLKKRRKNSVTQKSWRSVYLEEYEPALKRFFPVSERTAKTDAALKQILSEAKRKKYRATVYVSGGGYPSKQEKVFDFTRRKNPSAESIRKEFAGSVSGERDLYFPQGTPTGKLAKLGKLVSITTEEGTIKPVHGSAWLCSDERQRLHIGSMTNAPLFDGPKRSFGKVSKIEYQDVKKHLGHNKQTIFFHHVGEENGIKPTLAADGKGGLVFKGGDYRLTSRGLEN